MVGIRVPKDSATGQSWGLLIIKTSMAQKRMFDRAIIDTDRFMDLPMSAKAMYFLLGMEADDEGFVSYKKVLRIHGGNEDDVKLLTAKNFLIHFPSGVVVVTDWNSNNWLDSRRVRPTVYQSEKSMLTLTNDKIYVLSDGLAMVKPEERSIEESNSEQSSQEYVIVSLDEKEKRPPTAKYPNAPAITALFKEILGIAPLNWKTNRTQLIASENLFTERGIEKVRNALNFYIENKDKEYCPEILSPYDLDTKWTKLSGFKRKSV